MNKSQNTFWKISNEVKDALEAKKAVVALESSIISQGMPYPINITTALSCEEIIRKNNAVPATIAILDGKICIGLTQNEIEFLGQTNNKNLHKFAFKDLPFAISKNLSGGTTVSSTMFCAQQAGIKVFATGGIGGVHRGAEFSFDVSADLEALAKFNVAVVCAGVKSILDIGKTIEKLETLSVPTIGYQTNIFPAFYCQKSSFSVDIMVQNPQEIAKIIHTKWHLGLEGGVLIANPIQENDALDEEKIELLIKHAIQTAKEKGISGKAVTPFLLSQLSFESGEESLKANVSLVKNNAKLAAGIACALSDLTR